MENDEDDCEQSQEYMESLGRAPFAPKRSRRRAQVIARLFHKCNGVLGTRAGRSEEVTATRESRPRRERAVHAGKANLKTSGSEESLTTRLA